MTDELKMLTDEQIKLFEDQYENRYGFDSLAFARAIEAAVLAEQAKQAPVAWEVFNKHGRIFFRVGVQSFMLAYEPEDEPDSSAGQQAEWMMTQLRTALSKLATPVVQPDDTGAHEEAEYYAELNRGYAKDRM